MFYQGNTAKMTPSDTPSVEMAPAASENPNVVRITNKLGTFEYDRQLSIKFPNGVVGFPDFHEFGLANLPGSMADFKLLQCITEPSLSFFVLPVDPKTAPIDAEDIAALCDAFKINPDHLAMLFIVTIRSAGPGGGITMSINHRAPIVIDASNRNARQVVFSNNKYSVQHIIQ